MMKIFLILFLFNCEIVKFISGNIINEETIKNEIPMEKTTNSLKFSAINTAMTTASLTKITTTTLSPMDQELSKLFEIDLETQSTTMSNDEDDYDESQNITVGHRTTLKTRMNCVCIINNKCAENDWCERQAKNASLKIVCSSINNIFYLFLLILSLYV